MIGTNYPIRICKGARRLCKILTVSCNAHVGVYVLEGGSMNMSSWWKCFYMWRNSTTNKRRISSNCDTTFFLQMLNVVFSLSRLIEICTRRRMIATSKVAIRRTVPSSTERTSALDTWDAAFGFVTTCVWVTSDEPLLQCTSIVVKHFLTLLVEINSFALASMDHRPSSLLSYLSIHLSIYLSVSPSQPILESTDCLVDNIGFSYSTIVRALFFRSEFVNFVATTTVVR